MKKGGGKGKGNQAKTQGGAGGSGDSHRAVDNEFRAYLTRLANTLRKKEYENEEERQIIARNVFTEVNGKELPLSLHQGASILLETFLKEFNSYQIRTFAFHLDSKYLQLCFNCSGSHIMELLVSLLPKCIGNHDGEDEEEEEEVIKKQKKGEKEVIPPAEELILSICDQLSEAWGDLLQDNYASHVLRRIFYGLSGVNFDTLKVDEKLTAVLPASFRQYFLGIVSDMCMQPEGSFDLSELVFHAAASPTLQVILDLLTEVQDKKTLEKYIGKLLKFDTKDEAKYNAHIQKLTRHNIGSHVMEKVVQRAPAELYMRLFNNYFRGKLYGLIMDQAANFVVQQVIACAHNAAQAQLIFQELSSRDDAFQKLFEKGRGGVVLKMAELYLNKSGINDMEKKKLCRCIREGLQLPEEGNSKEEGKTKKRIKTDFDAKLLLELKSGNARRGNNNDYNSVGPQFSAIGCMIAQTLLRYPPSCITWFVKSLTNLGTQYLVSMALSGPASRVIEAFLADTCTSPVKRKLELIDLLKGHFVALAKSKFGSHVVEHCYKAANVAKKEMIAQELSAVEKPLMQDMYGKIVLLNCKIGQYKKKQEEWKERMQGNEKKRKMFEEILNEKEPEKETPENGTATTTAKVEKKEQPAQKKPKKVIQLEEREKVMEVLGFGKKRKRLADDEDEAEEGENEKEKEKKEDGKEKEKEEETGTKKKGNKKKKKKEEKDDSLDFIMGILSSTKKSEQETKKEQKKKTKSKKKKPKQKKAKIEKQEEEEGKEE